MTPAIERDMDAARTPSGSADEGSFKPARSTRVSKLVSRFETASSFEPTIPPALSSVLASKPPRSWSKVEGERVKKHVRRFSSDRVPVADQVASAPIRRTSTKSIDVVRGNLDELDWTPRPRLGAGPPPVSDLPTSLDLVPPPPAARFLRPQIRSRATVGPVVSANVESFRGGTSVNVETAQPPSYGPTAVPTKGDTLLLPEKPSEDATTTSTAAISEHDSSKEVARQRGPPPSGIDAPPLSTPFLDGAALDRLDLPISPPPPFSRALPSFRTVASSTTTRAYPAYQVFARDAAPLRLPELDRTLGSLGGLPQFTSLPSVSCERSSIQPWDLLGQSDGHELDDLKERRKGEADDGEACDGENSGNDEERKSWEEWLETQPRLSVADRLEKLASRFRGSQDKDADREILVDGGLSTDESSRSRIFPPFHLLPPDVTLSDLKQNRRRPPGFLSGNGILQTLADGALNIFGSAAGIKLTTIEGLRDLMQMITLLVTSASPALSPLTLSSPMTPTRPIESSAFRTALITIPSALSLDLASAFGQASIFLLCFTLLAVFALYEFFRFTGGWNAARGERGIDVGEGYDREDLHEQRRSFRDGRRWKIFVTFFLTTIYLPLSKLYLSALFWERGFWSSELYGTSVKDDRCFTTLAAGKSGFNGAIVILPVAVVVLVSLGWWFPIRMHRIIAKAKPTIDKWTELGELRRDRNVEYERLLDHDPSPYSFLYREYRREWASFRAIYMAVKLVNVFLVVLISKDNCIFKTYGETKLDVIRQGSLFAFMMFFFLLDVYSRPQLDPISNRSDRVSRAGYVGISLCGLFVALSLPGSRFFDEGAIIIINSVTYSLNIYFTIISTQLLKRFVKQVRRRLDHSIDVFSPDLDVSKHITRRIWQETFSVLFLASSKFAMSPSTSLVFTQEDGLAPYLLNFRSTVAERHVENLKILREIGPKAYLRGLDNSTEALALQRRLLHDFAGPDVYFRAPEAANPLVSTFFGRLDIVPFPFVAVLRYDQDPSEPLFLRSTDDLRLLVAQQESLEVRSKKKVRLALRALEGQTLDAPRWEVHPLKDPKGTTVEQRVEYRQATLTIGRNSTFKWRGYNHASGFDVSLEYTDGYGLDVNGKTRSNMSLTVTGTDTGISSDFALTRALACLLQRNREIVEERLPLVEDALRTRRRYFADEAAEKSRVLSHGFLTSVYAEPVSSVAELDQRLRAKEQNSDVQNLVRTYPTTFRCLEERMQSVLGSRLRAWWFVLWDDLWRRNCDLGAIKSRPADFSPQYSTSLCYNPMKRADLEAFLERGGFDVSRSGFFHPGLLNQIYFLLDEMAFSATSEAIPIHLASDPFDDVHFSSLPRKLAPTQAHSAVIGSQLTAGTGDGTNEDDRDIRTRPTFRFEEAFERARPRFVRGRRREAVRYFATVRIKEGLVDWLGWNPSERRGVAEEAEVLLDLRKDRDGWSAPCAVGH
ncbi:hypothetical protein JCM10212_002919 [Sporobolomyces blumeae]